MNLKIPKEIKNLPNSEFGNAIKQIFLAMKALGYEYNGEAYLNGEENIFFRKGSIYVGISIEED